MTNEANIPGPAFCAASAVNTNMPVPMMAPTPSIMSWNPPSVRESDRFSAVARMASSGLMRQFMSSPVFCGAVDFSGFPAGHPLFRRTWPAGGSLP
jgi:hypothetical protein